MKRILSDKKFNDGTAIRIDEYEVRDIDSFGDVIDVNHTQDLNEAKRWMANQLTGEAVARVLEFHRSFFLARTGEAKYKTIEVVGDTVALKAGGWVE